MRDLAHLTKSILVFELQSKGMVLNRLECGVALAQVSSAWSEETQAALKGRDKRGRCSTQLGIYSQRKRFAATGLKKVLRSCKVTQFWKKDSASVSSLSSSLSRLQ
jgi:hypothetical protein